MVDFAGLPEKTIRMADMSYRSWPALYRYPASKAASSVRRCAGRPWVERCHEGPYAIVSSNSSARNRKSPSSVVICLYVEGRLYRLTLAWHGRRPVRSTFCYGGSDNLCRCHVKTGGASRLRSPASEGKGHGQSQIPHRTSKAACFPPTIKCWSRHPYQRVQPNLLQPFPSSNRRHRRLQVVSRGPRSLSGPRTAKDSTAPPQVLKPERSWCLNWTMLWSPSVPG